MNELMEVNAVTKVYRDGVAFTALKNISLSVYAQDYLAIVGPSGAGKSTLLHIMGGLEPPTKGKVFFIEKSLYKMKDRELSLWRTKSAGFVFQFYHLIEELSVLENVAIAASREGRKYSFKKARELLKYLGLEDKQEAFPSQLSGGQKQRVAIARALVNEPEILFCDEPTGNLDKESQEKIAGLLENLNKVKKKTIVLVTHNLELAKQAKRILFIEGGEIKNAK